MRALDEAPVVREPRRARVLVHLRLLERRALDDARERLPHPEELPVVHVLRRLVLWVLQAPELWREHVEQALRQLDPSAACAKSEEGGEDTG